MIQYVKMNHNYSDYKYNIRKKLWRLILKVVIVFNHPYDESYCNSVREAVSRGLEKAGYEIDLIHLDKDGFDPVMTLEDLKAFKNKKSIHPHSIDYNDRIKKAEHLIFIFPIWWDLMPARMKGFIDKVIFPGEAYDYASKGHDMVPLWTNLRSTTIISTMNTPALRYRFKYGDAMKKAFVNGTLLRIGCKRVKWISLNMIKKSSSEQREKWLVDLEKQFSQFK